MFRLISSKNLQITSHLFLILFFHINLLRFSPNRLSSPVIKTKKNSICSVQLDTRAKIKSLTILYIRFQLFYASREPRRLISFLFRKRDKIFSPWGEELSKKTCDFTCRLFLSSRRNEFSSQRSLLTKCAPWMLVHHRITLSKVPFSPFVFASSFQGWLCDFYFPPRSHYPISVVYRNFSSLDSILYFFGNNFIEWQ